MTVSEQMCTILAASWFQRHFSKSDYKRKIRKESRKDHEADISCQ